MDTTSGPAPPGQPAAAFRAGQPSARQPPLDLVPISIYREYRRLQAPLVRPSRLRCQIEGREGRRLPRRDHGAVAHQKGQPHGLPSRSSSSLSKDPLKLCGS